MARAGASALGGAAGGGTYGFGAGEGGARSRFAGAVPAAVLGGGIGAVAPAVGRAVGKLVGKPGNRAGVQAKGLTDKEIIAKAPSTETLKAQSGALYDKADEARSNSSTGSIRNLSRRHRRGLIATEGVDDILHPSAARAFKRALEIPRENSR